MGAAYNSLLLVLGFKILAVLLSFLNGPASAVLTRGLARHTGSRMHRFGQLFKGTVCWSFGRVCLEPRGAYVQWIVSRPNRMGPRKCMC